MVGDVAPGLVCPGRGIMSAHEWRWIPEGLEVGGWECVRIDLADRWGPTLLTRLTAWPNPYVRFSKDRLGRFVDGELLQEPSTVVYVAAPTEEARAFRRATRERVQALEITWKAARSWLGVQDTPSTDE